MLPYNAPSRVLFPPFLHDTPRSIHLPTTMLPVPFSIKNTFLCVGTPRTASGEFHFQHRKRASCPALLEYAHFPSSHPHTLKNSSAEGTPPFVPLVNDEREGKNPGGPCPFPSLGSTNHYLDPDLCNPCGFERSKGCYKGEQCHFCHLCPRKPRRKKRQQQKERVLQRSGNGV